MKINVLFFGATADAVGSRETSLTIDGIANVGTALSTVLTEHPSLGNHHLLFSVNQEYATRQTAINDGDELAIFTPVSGG